jgi:hypothetical protein
MWHDRHLREERGFASGVWVYPIRNDSQLIAALNQMTLAELMSLQDALNNALGSGHVTTTAWAQAIDGHSTEAAIWLCSHPYRDEESKLVILLATLAVAIAWMTYRKSPASESDLQQAMGTARDGHAYMLPIPRGDPCFCGSRAKFRLCHGMPPVAEPAM